MAAAFVACILTLSGAHAQAPDTLRSGILEFRFWSGDDRLARALAERALAVPLPVLPPDVLAQGTPIIIQLAPDEAALDSLTMGQAPDWGAGVAFPDRGEIILPAYASRRGDPGELHGVLRHELAHVALQRFIRSLRAPRWFTEGYATWAGGQLDDSAGWLLRLAFLTGDAPPLDSLALDWPAGTTDARVAYLLSASAVQYLHENGGDRVMRIFLDRWLETQNFERALFGVYGLAPGQLEEHWSKWVRRRYGWVLFLSQNVVIWTVIGGIVLAMSLIRRRRNRMVLARLRAAELPDDPAFWLEQTDDESTSPPVDSRMSSATGPHEGRPRDRIPDSEPDNGDGSAR